MTKKVLKTAVEGLAGALGARLEMDKNNGKSAQKGEKEKAMKKRIKKAPVAPKTATTALATTPEVVQPATPPAPVPPAQPTPPRLSLKEQILMASKKVDTTAIIAAVDEAHEILTDTDTNTAFVNAILAADQLLIQQGMFERSEEEVVNAHYNMSYTELKAKLAKIGGEESRGILDLLAYFEGSKLEVVSHLWQMVVEIVRPAEQVDNIDDLAYLMSALAEDGKVKALTNPRNYPNNSIVVEGPTNNFAYLPNTQMATAGWFWVKDAETRANKKIDEEESERAKKFAELKSKEIQISLSQAKNGEDGYVFVEIGRGENRGALLHIERECVQIVDTVGCDAKPITKLLRWDAGYNAWPKDAKDIYHALFAWRNAKFSAPAKAG